MISNKKLGKRLRELRKKSGLSQKQVANYLNLDQSMISKIESGVRVIDISDLNNLSYLYCCPISNLTSEDDLILSSVKFRTQKLEDSDLKALKDINRIVLDQFFMDDLKNKNDG